ncbi:transcription regulator protein BACH1b isoform X1 [Centroberyx affinis]|uniref:transcription regulator protein BACH1b isoform X1 n=2 Tax=Centroberyx affinis TaxID=166261 RepID=UPI003A5C203F
MSLMTMSAPRSSVFTFESTVHSCHVLRCLDDQRRRDLLCDVTVLVEGQSFRAHRSVLASCSEYFTHRISSHTQHVITLPQEVTAAGFEPLLKFAYTSKLLFSKENVLDVRNSASILGFRDLDKACFDFLLPKFFSSSRGSAPFQRKTCCKKRCKRQLSKEGSDNDGIAVNEKEVKPVDSPSEQEVAWLSNKSVSSLTGSKSSTGAHLPVADAQSEGTNVSSLQCPKYRKFQLACGKETCGKEKSLEHPAAVTEDACALSCLPCSSSGSCKNVTEAESPGQSFSSPDRRGEGGVDEPFETESHAVKIERDVGRGEVDKIKRDTDEREGKRDEKEREMGVVKMEEEKDHIARVSSSRVMAPLADRSSVKGVSSGPSAVLGERSAGLILHHCPLNAFDEDSAITGSVGQERFTMDVTEDKKPRDSGVLEAVSIHQEAEEQAGGERRRVDIEMDSGWQERGRGEGRGSMESVALHGERKRSSVEREVAEDLAKRLGSEDTSSSSDTGNKQVQSPSLDWLKLHVNLSSKPTGCPFLQDLDQSKSEWNGAGEAKLSGCAGMSQSGKCVSSLNSGEDGDSETETEGDSESYTRERARQVQLPFSVDWIVDLTRNDFQQLLKQQSLTREQLDFVHDMRRRSKNRIAARRCRKRKLDCIYNLQCEINKLKTEREKLITERSQLSQLKSNTCHSVSALCQRVCNEANLQPDQLQVLAKYSSPDCPLASFFPHTDSLLTQPGVPLQPQASLPACSSSSGLDMYKASLGPSSSSSRDTVRGDGRHSGDGKAP